MDARKTLPKLTDRLSLGQTGLKVSPFCLGLVSSEDTTSAAFDAGINFFFITADMHWPLYEMARRGLDKLLARGSNIRDQIVVALVSYSTQPEFCSAPFIEVLQSMPRLQKVDVAVAGGSYSHEILTRLRVYDRHRAQKFLGIQAIGSSFHDRAAAAQCINQNLVDIAYIRYNSGHPGARFDLFPLLNGKSSTLVYNFKNTSGFVAHERYPQLGLNSEHWHPKVTDHYRFALTRPQLNGILCSPATPEEVGNLAKALEEGPLDEEEENYLMNLNELNEGRATLASDTETEKP